MQLAFDLAQARKNEHRIKVGQYRGMRRTKPMAA
jgi:hypothetical protein